MLDVFLDALIDSLKTLPFLFAAYFLIEYLEHRASGRFQNCPYYRPGDEYTIVRKQI